jgi:uncharacterized protein (TIGR04222 family)
MRQLMNPLALPIERFMALYTALAAILLATSALMWLMIGRGARPAKLTELTADPYRIAYLRAGPSETLHVALFNLVDRGILEYDGSRLRTLRADALETLRRPLDRLLVKVCKGPVSVKDLARNSAVRAALETYENELGARGLVSAGPQWTRRMAFGWASVALLVGLMGARVLHEIARGGPNIGTFLAPVLFASVLVVTATHRRRSYTGGRMLAALRTMFERLKARAPVVRRGGETNEALLIAATFSLYELPADVFPFIEEMFPRPRGGLDVDGSSDGGGDSGSCGGGCGGCGGCGG